MSAFMVDAEVIDVLVGAALAVFTSDDGSLRTPGGELRLHNPAHADKVGRLLWSANVSNMRYLYPGDGSEFSESMNEVLDYRYTPIPGLVRERIPYLAGRIEAVAGCFEYQCCDEPRWDRTPTWEFLCRLRRALLKTIPGCAEQGFSPVDRDTFAAVPARAS